MKLRENKVKWLSESEKTIRDSGSFIFAAFQGMTVREMTDLRIQLRRVQARTEVIKNRLFKRLMNDEWDNISEFVQGPTAVIFSDEDGISDVCKVLTSFAKETENFSIRGGFLKTGRVLTGDDVNNIALIPDRNTLLAMVARGMQAPIQNFRNVCSLLVSRIATVLNDYAQKKKES